MDTALHKAVHTYGTCNITRMTMFKFNLELISVDIAFAQDFPLGPQNILVVLATREKVFGGLSAPPNHISLYGLLHLIAG